MSRSWWPPWRRKSDTTDKSKALGEVGNGRRFEDTRRIVRHIKKRALFPEQAPEPIPPPLGRPSAPTVTIYGSLIHVNFHQSEKIVEGTFVKKDPITRKLKRVAKRFDRSEVFYTENGRLIDDNTI